jgi:hypothetical protein
VGMAMNYDVPRWLRAKARAASAPRNAAFGSPQFLRPPPATSHDSRAAHPPSRLFIFVPIAMCFTAEISSPLDYHCSTLWGGTANSLPG